MMQTAENLSRAAAAQVTAEAKQATLAFADYLRMNMSTLNTRELVPFSRELDHIKTYLFLEQLRFGAERQVVMDVGTTDFMLPALTGAAAGGERRQVGHRKAGERRHGAADHPHDTAGRGGTVGGAVRRAEGTRYRH